ncbi:MAG: thioredoxin family protein, partial [Cyanobacteria bacterium J06641_5]
AFTVPPVVVTVGTPAPSPVISSIPLWQTFGLAFLGGIVLNLMPCVFPVLSLKALGIVQKTQKHPQQVRLQVLAFTAGVLTSLIAVAGSLLALRSLGQQIGWGFQLQSPAFVMLLAYLLFGIGLNLSGVFIFGASWMGVGQRLTEQPGYAGEFFSGVLATIVATPCTAPFMATAIGAALTQPAPVAIAIFAVLGLGLALPYGAIALIPGLQQRLPKPGAWMQTLQQLLAFPMYGAAAWLVWVLVQQAGTNALAAVSSGFITLGFAAWLYQKTRPSPHLAKQLGAVTALALLGFALTLARIPEPLAIAPDALNAAARASTIPWEPYSAQRLAELRQQDRPVFVNFTANWCITCLVNDRSVLRRPEIIETFAEQDIIYLKGDWTSRNRTITKALESFGRSGVPLYVFYAPGKDAIVLPQILSVESLKNILKI